MIYIRRINYLLIIFLLISFSNSPTVIGLLFSNQKLDLISNYSGYLLVLIAFGYSITFYNDRKHFNKALFLFKQSIGFPLFLLMFYIAGTFSCSISGSFDSFLIILPLMIRCLVSAFLFTWLFSFLIIYGQDMYYLKYLRVILFLSILSIIILKYFGIELAFFINKSLWSPDNVIGRASGFFINPNIAAQYTILTIILFLYYSIGKVKSKISNNITLFVILSICLYALFITFSNTGFINLLIVLLFYFIIKSKSKIKFLLLFISFFTFFELIILPYIEMKEKLYYSQNNTPIIQQNKVGNFINILELSGPGKIDLSLRGKIANAGWEKIIRNPILGYGSGSFQSGIYNEYGIHNTFLQVLGETGIIVFIVYIIFFLRLFIRSYQIKDKKLRFLVLTTVTSIIIYQLTTHGILYNENILIIIIFFNIISIYKGRKWLKLTSKKTLIKPNILTNY